MKRKLSLILLVMMIFTMIFATYVSAEVMPRYNNTLYTGTDFAITDDGRALVAVSCDGYTGVTTRITVSIRIEKRSFLLFWNEVVVDSHTVRATSIFETYEYQLSDKGTYRCTVTYSVSGSGGEDDTIMQEFTDTY